MIEAIHMPWSDQKEACFRFNIGPDSTIVFASVLVDATGSAMGTVTNPMQIALTATAKDGSTARTAVTVHVLPAPAAMQTQQKYRMMIQNTDGTVSFR